MSNPSPSADSKWQLDPSEAQKWKALVSYDEASVDLQGESLDSVTDVNANKILQDYAKQPNASPEVLRLLQDIKELSGKADETKKEMENESAFDRYTSGDIRWVRAVYNSLAEVARSIRDTRTPDGGKIARYQKAAQASLGPNGDQATFDFSEKKGYRVAIVGDVGTCDDHQDEAIKRAIAAKADIICHLGDIYYCGTSDECADFWDHYDNARGGTKVPLFSIPGNHEYISGGGGFFNALLPKLGLTDRGKPQLSSFFCLRFPASGGKLGVQIIGLDTGLNTTYSEVVGGVAEALHKTEGISETKLSKEELAWLESRLQDKEYQTILLTHHQPRSPHWNPTTLRSPLWEQLQPVLVKYPEVKLWLWGHEHRIRIYTDTYLPVKANESDEKGVYHIKGRCVGNSSMPERVPTKLLRVDEPSAYYHLNDGDCIATNLGSSLDGIYNSYTNCAYALVTIGEGGDFKVEYNRVMWDPSKPNVDPILYTDKFGALPK